MKLYSTGVFRNGSRQVLEETAVYRFGLGYFEVKKICFQLFLVPWSRQKYKQRYR